MPARLRPRLQLHLRRLAAFALIAAAPVAVRAGDAASAVDYNRDVRPILSANCFKCHGPDEDDREADLRLDVRAAALAPAGSGAPAIVPGKPEQSGLVKRVFSDKRGTMMPPPESGKTLTDAQKAALRAWIAQGAPYQSHWAYHAPRRQAVPAVKTPDRVHGPLDAFILARLEREGLEPAPEADRATLIRRVTLDLTGLPPTPAEVDAFLADARPDAYERLVDRLLASPRYGERMALDWLDAARFADTHGYHIDSGRDMTRWREWVIDAFNRDLPFDRFTVEQIAGDLLPAPTLEQKVASGFNRNHMITFEGGAIPEEYHAAYVVDRVNTTGTVWLGLTIACAQCHDHKYDPLTQKDFYRFYAFFNNVPENGLDGSKGNAAPMIAAPDAAQRRALARLADARRDAEEFADFQSRTTGPTFAALDRLDAARKAEGDFQKTIPTAMVMSEMGRPRDTFLLIRGAYDKKGEAVAAGVPSFLPPLPAGSKADRLGLARWLVDPSNPLVGRVVVNRLWQAFFGVGLVRTAEDFGATGEPPSHPELLDALAVEFAAPDAPGATAWDVKRLVRGFVTSATYRRRSSASAALIARDPENRLLARGPRYRLPAEVVRDQALALAGLLNGEIGGKSVSPYQPPGLWEELMSREDGKNWSAQTYSQSHGKDLYRRTMYTFWKRTSPPPSLATFDAPDRETCTVRRARTNTPLQALVLLNDPTYVEAARKLAERVLHDGAVTDADRVACAFRLAAARPPRPAESAVLLDVLRSDRDRFRADPAAARRLLAVGESPRDDRLDAAEHAAWTTVASVILNLDEVLNKN
jgi:mono/diheme cytochrome c family protein